MIKFIVYSLLASFFWGIMSVTESYVGQYEFHGALFIRYMVYGTVGLIFLFSRYRKITEGLGKIVLNKPKSMALLIFGILAGTLGTYLVYCAYDICGKNKNIVIIIAYTFNVLVISVLSYFFLDEKLNNYALMGIFCILLGICILEYKGTVPVTNK